MKVTNVLIASVGGQGGLTLSRVLAIAAVIEGKSVVTGETLGMAQRFGSVVSYVRIGDEVHSPVFSLGDADVILGLELIEVLRNIHYLRSKGLVLSADELKPPVSSSLGLAKNPKRDKLMSEITSKANELDGDVIFIPARQLAVEAGSYRAMNMVILGAFNSRFKLLSDPSIQEAIMQLLPGNKGKISVRAYNSGKEFLNK